MERFSLTWIPTARDLLPDRSAESFSTWLQQHPEIETIARDRYGL
jgi:hypothetical protein